MKEDDNMPDLSKHPLFLQLYELQLAIEACAASPDVAHAHSLVLALYEPVDALVDGQTAALFPRDVMPVLDMEAVTREALRDVEGLA